MTNYEKYKLLKLKLINTYINLWVLKNGYRNCFNQN